MNGGKVCLRIIIAGYDPRIRVKNRALVLALALGRALGSSDLDEIDKDAGMKLEIPCKDPSIDCLVIS